MATLHMDVDACTSLKSNMNNTKEQISQQITNLATDLNGMIGTTFIGPDADQFQSRFAASQAKMNNVVDQLNELSIRFGNIIQAWEEVGARF